MRAIHKSFRYRVYPTPEQASRLVRWEGYLRFLWNCAHEHRRSGLSRDPKEYLSAFDQMKELTAAKVILSRGDHGVAVCGGYPVGGPMKQKQRSVSPAQLPLGPEGHKASPFREGLAQVLPRLQAVD